MAKPRFNLKNKNDDPTLIVLVYRYNGRKLVHSTSMTVSPKDWNDRAMRVRETAGNLESQVINDDLDRLEELVKSVHRKFRTEDQVPSVLEFKRRMEEQAVDGANVAGASFTRFMDTFIAEREESPLYARGSIKVYKTTRNHFNRYAQHRTVEFADLTRTYLMGFQQYLYGNDFSDNYVNKLYKTVTTILNDATERKLNKTLDYKSRKLSVPKREADNVYLSEDELRRMTELDLGNDHRLARVRDLFLIGAYTGLRYSDFISLTPNNLIELEGEEVFEVHTVKTNDQLYIPTHPIVLDILKHHGGPPKPMSNQKLNKYLKELCQMIGLSETVTKRTYKGGVRREEHYKKWELVSSHTARRSFATNAYKEKMDAIAIMKITGHKQYDTFMKYIKVDKKENAVRMAGHPYFKKASALPYSLNAKATSK